MKLMITGHRPPKYFSYSRNDPNRLRLKEIYKEKLLEFRPEMAYSGLALGVDQDFCDVCAALSIPFTACIPFIGHSSNWKQKAQDVYNNILRNAAKKVIISYQNAKDMEKFELNQALQRRNEYMVDSIGEDGVVLACWDQKPSGTMNCAKYAEKLNRQIVIINPQND
jgi:uncharacterized phage-like protein YoqJ